MLKTYDVSKNIFYDSVVIVTKEKGSSYSFEYKCGGVFLTTQAEYPFMALAEMRKLLKERGLLILCEGSRIDVYPSGFSFSSFLAYKVVLGRPGGKENLVNILDPINDVDFIGSLEEQEAYRVKWMESL